MSKYIDLEDTLLQSCHKAHDYPFVVDVKIVLAWLDNHPDQVPGRTITEGDLIAAVDETNHEDMNEYQKARALLVHLGHTVPDPEPTNAELLDKDIQEVDLHLTSRQLAEALIERGWTKGGDEL